METMADLSQKRSIVIVSACMTAQGTPTFAFTEVEVSQEEAENGVHYYLAEANLLEAGYEEPFVHFDADEAPAFLHPAVRQFLGIAPSVAPNSNHHIALTEDR
jgi:hypothetical protein